MKQSLAVLALILMVSTATAQTACGARDKVASGLEKGYSEFSMFTGAIDGGATLEFFLNATTGTWTLTITADKISCVRAVGTKWKGSAPPKGLGL